MPLEPSSWIEGSDVTAPKVSVLAPWTEIIGSGLSHISSRLCACGMRPEQATRPGIQETDKELGASGLFYFDSAQHQEELEAAVSGALVGENLVMDYTPSAQDASVGLLTSGLQWLQKRKSRNRQKYLQAEAEAQMQILRDHFADAVEHHEAVEATASWEENEDDEPHVSQSGHGFSVQLSVNDEAEEWVPPVRIEDEEGPNIPPYILSQIERNQVAQLVLPRGISYARWTRLYSLARDGDAFGGALRLVKGHNNTLMVIRSSRGHILGGFADQAWEPRAEGYFGGATACLFRVDRDDDTSTVVPYKWSGANRYIQLCDLRRKLLAFGGGGQEGAFGLAVTNDFVKGSTGHCATFDNEPLCAPENFDVVDLEIYSFLIGQF